MYYTLSFVKPDTVLRTTQALNFSGDIKVTKYWKIGITSGYDFVHHALSFTRLNLYRDLRCWEFRVDWIPFGQMQSYNFSINMKTSMLRDLKVQHGKLWFDTY